MRKGLSKGLSVLVGLAMALSMTACGNSAASGSASASSSASDKATDGGKTLRIYCWNDEFKNRFTDYFEKAGKLPSDVKVEWVTTPNENNAYQNKLDEALKNQASAAPDDRVDLFLFEADYALKYVNSDYTLDVKKDLGLTDEDMSQQYQYTKDIVTDSNGIMKGISWQATPGLFVYRRSLAKEVLGTDDPSKVQEAVADWNKFEETAQKMKDKGHLMLSGYDDTYRAFSNNVSKPWVDKDNKIQIDDNIMKWVDQTKDFTDKGYNEKTKLWDTDWQKGQGPSGNVFGYFYSTWGVNYTLLENSLATPLKEGGKKEVGNGIFGDWAVCQGPMSYYWGGSWIAGATGTDNKTLVHDIMETLTCDPETMKKITEDTDDYTNNKKAMEEMANSDYKSAFLGGPNHIKDFAQAAPKIDMSNAGPYDQGCNEEFQKAFHDYFDGKVSKEQALDNFYKGVLEKYPNLSK